MKALATVILTFSLSVFVAGFIILFAKNLGLARVGVMMVRTLVGDELDSPLKLN